MEENQGDQYEGPKHELHSYYIEAFQKQFHRKPGKPKKVVVYDKAPDQKINLQELSERDPLGTYPFIGLSTSASTGSPHAEFISISNLSGCTVIIQTGEVSDLRDEGWEDVREILALPTCLKFGQNMSVHIAAIERRYQIPTAGWINLEWLFWEPETSKPQPHSIGEYISKVFGRQSADGESAAADSPSYLTTAQESQFAVDIAAFMLLNWTKTKEPAIWSECLVPDIWDPGTYVCHVERKEAAMGYTDRCFESSSWTGDNERLEELIRDFKSRCTSAKDALRESDTHYSDADRVRTLYWKLAELRNSMLDDEKFWINQAEFEQLSEEFSPAKPKLSSTTWLASAKRYCQCSLTFDLPGFQKTVKAVEEGTIRSSMKDNSTIAASKAIQQWCEDFLAHFERFVQDIRKCQISTMKTDESDAPWFIRHQFTSESELTDEEIHESLLNFTSQSEEFLPAPGDLLRSLHSDEDKIDVLWVKNLKLEFDHKGDYECGFAPFSRVYLVSDDGKPRTDSVFKVIDNFLNAVLICHATMQAQKKWVSKNSIIRVSAHQESLRREEEARKKREYAENIRKLEEKAKKEREERIRMLKEKRRLEEERKAERKLRSDVQRTVLELLIAVDIIEDMTSAETAKELIKRGDPFVDKNLMIKLQLNDPELKKMFAKPICTSHGEIQVIDGLLTFVTGSGVNRREKICIPAVLRQTLIKGFCNGTGPGRYLLEKYYWNSCRKDMDQYLDDFINIRDDGKRQDSNGKRAPKNVVKNIISKATLMSRRKPLVIKMKEIRSMELKRKIEKSSKSRVPQKQSGKQESYHDYEDVVIPINYQGQQRFQDGSFRNNQNSFSNIHNRNQTSQSPTKHSGKEKSFKNAPQEFGIAVVYDYSETCNDSTTFRRKKQYESPKKTVKQLDPGTNSRYSQINDIGSAVVYESPKSAKNRNSDHNIRTVPFIPKPHSMGSFLSGLRSQAPMGKNPGAHPQLPVRRQNMPNNFLPMPEYAFLPPLKTPLLPSSIPNDPNLEPGEVPPPQGWSESAVARVPKRKGAPTGDWFQSHLLGGFVRPKEVIPVSEIPLPREIAPPQPEHKSDISIRKKDQLPLPYPGTERAEHSASIFATSFVPKKQETPVPILKSSPTSSMPNPPNLPKPIPSEIEKPKIFKPFEIKLKKPVAPAEPSVKTKKSTVSTLQESLGLKRKKKPAKTFLKKPRKMRPFSLPSLPTPLLKAIGEETQVPLKNIPIPKPVTPVKIPTPKLSPQIEVRVSDVHHYETELSKRIKSNWSRFRSQPTEPPPKPAPIPPRSTLSADAPFPLPYMEPQSEPGCVDDGFSLDDIPLPQPSKKRAVSKKFQFYESNNPYGFQ